MVTISFDQQLVSSNSMTRTTSNEFLDIIEEQTPSYVNVTLKNLDLNKTFTCESNETITIPIGNYKISAEYIGQYVQLSSAGNDKMYERPIINCKTFNHTISSNTTNITLNVYYNCYAIFALIDECKSVTTPSSYVSGGNLSLGKQGKYYVGYFNKENTTINLTPYDNSNDFITTTYNFSTTYDVNKVYVEYGKYYVIHPQSVSKTNSQFIINLDKMEEGTF
jgi:hypothetical protein